MDKSSLLVLLAVGAFLILLTLIDNIVTRAVFARLTAARTRLIVAVLWCLSAVILFVPGGVVSQIYGAGDRFVAVKGASPFGQVCYFSGKAATHSATYSDGKVRYFCDDHWPPPASVPSSASTRNGMSVEFSLFVVLGIYGINYIRVITHVLTRGQRIQTTLAGAVWALVGSLFLLAWFGTRH